MGRWFIVLGVLTTLAGIGGIVWGVAGPVRSVVSSATRTPDAATYCRPGETIVEESGASGYRPGMGYAHTAYYYCVDKAGARRDVTGAVAQDLIQDTVSGVGVSVVVAALMSGLILLGALLIMLGIILVIRRRVANGARVRVVETRIAP